jgi:hypothetical protein
MSAKDPAGAGTIILIGRSGYVCVIPIAGLMHSVSKAKNCLNVRVVIMLSTGVLV